MKQRQTFKKLCELKMKLKLIESHASELDGFSVGEEVMIVKYRNQIETLQNYLRSELNE